MLFPTNEVDFYGVYIYKSCVHFTPAAEITRIKEICITLPLTLPVVVEEDCSGKGQTSRLGLSKLYLLGIPSAHGRLQPRPETPSYSHPHPHHHPDKSLANSIML